MNLEFRYMYRDCGNWKNHGSVIFGNRSGLLKEDIERRIVKLIDIDWFIDASVLKLPPLFFRGFSYDPQLDHPMHEFIGLYETSNPVSDLERRDIAELLASMTK